MRLPGTIIPGTTCDGVAATLDLLPTIASLTGGKLSDHLIDGHDLGALLKDPASPSPRDKAGFMYYFKGGLEGVRLGKWKLRRAGGLAGGKKPGKLELYDLESDISESNNLAEKEPEVVARLSAFAAEFDAGLQANKRPAWSRKPK